MSDGQNQELMEIFVCILQKFKIAVFQQQINFAALEVDFGSHRSLDSKKKKCHKKQFYYFINDFFGYANYIIHVYNKN